MKERDLQLEKYGITFWAYRELRAFCRQYPQKKKLADSLIGGGGSQLTGTPRSAAVSDPTFRAAVRREKLMADIGIIETCAARAGNGEWQRAIILNVCYGVTYERIPPEALRSSRRNDFFNARREFYVLLNRARSSGDNLDTQKDMNP